MHARDGDVLCKCEVCAHVGCGSADLVLLVRLQCGLLLALDAGKPLRQVIVLQLALLVLRLIRCQPTHAVNAELNHGHSADEQMAAHLHPTRISRWHPWRQTRWHGTDLLLLNSDLEGLDFVRVLRKLLLHFSCHSTLLQHRLQLAKHAVQKRAGKHTITHTATAAAAAAVDDSVAGENKRAVRFEKKGVQLGGPRRACCLYPTRHACTGRFPHTVPCGDSGQPNARSNHDT